MNKTEVIEAIAEATEVSKADVGRVLESYHDTIASALKGGDTVTIPGFGAFSVKERSARTGRNPQTGETIQIAASKSPGFKPGKGFKEAIK